MRIVVCGLVIGTTQYAYPVSSHSIEPGAACPQFFAGGVPPQLVGSAKIGQHGIALCYGFFALLESGLTRTPLWSAEHLTRDSVALAHDEKRHDAFHVESALDPEQRAELSDYRGTGYDRGHMSPSGDMPDAGDQEESFSLANMVPQEPDNNRHLWQGIEIATRAFAKADGELYVVTGPVFLDQTTVSDGRVHVPTHLWKAIYDPSRGAAAYLTANRAGDGYTVISIDELERLTGIDPFPALADSVKSVAMAMPSPRPSGRKMKTGAVTLAELGIDTGATNVAHVTGMHSDRIRHYQAGVLEGDSASQQKHERDVAARMDAWLAPLRDAIKPWLDTLFRYLQNTPARHSS